MVTELHRLLLRTFPLELFSTNLEAEAEHRVLTGLPLLRMLLSSHLMLVNLTGHIAVYVRSRSHEGSFVGLSGDGEHCSCLNTCVIAAEKHTPASRHESMTKARNDNFHRFSDDCADMFVIS